LALSADSSAVSDIVLECHKFSLFNWSLAALSKLLIYVVTWPTTNIVGHINSK